MIISSGGGVSCCKELYPVISIPRCRFLAPLQQKTRRGRRRRRPLVLGANSLGTGPNQSPTSSLETETKTQTEQRPEEGDDPWEEVRFLDPEVVEEKGSNNNDSIWEWELDFCSRPILDERGKNVWELVVCDNTLSLQYTRFFPNNVINSVTLRDAIASIADTLRVPLP